MNKKSPSELEEYKITKTLRTVIRLKHSLAADEEINDLIPDTVHSFREALTRGELLQIGPVLEGIINGATDTEV